MNHGFIQGGKNVDVVALALAKQEIQNIVDEAIKKTKAAKTSKQLIKYMGTGRGENVIFAQENSILVKQLVFKQIALLHPQYRLASNSQESHRCVPKLVLE